MSTAISIATTAPPQTYSETQLDLLRNTICKGATDDEFRFFIQVARHSGLDPFARQIHAVRRWDKKAGKDVMSIQTSVDGFRLIAQRTGDYEGQTAPQWCGEDMVWVDVWLSNEPPSAARVGARRRGFHEPAWGVARWKSYAQQGKEGLSPMWARMPDAMLAKCAECLALRKAFPQEMHGLYADEEMPAQQEKAVKQATATGEAKTRKPTWDSDQQRRGGELRARFQLIGGDAWVTQTSRRMAYDDPEDVIAALTAVDAKWTPDTRQAAAGAVEALHAASASGELDSAASKWDWAMPLDVIDALHALLRTVE